MPYKQISTLIQVAKQGRHYSGVIKQNKVIRTWGAAVLSLVVAALVVWVWQLVESPNHNRASIATSPDVSDGSSINSDVNTQSGTSSDSPGNSSVVVQKNSDAPAIIMVNGQQMPVPANGSVHKSDGATNVDVNVQNGSSTNSNTQNSNVFSSSNSNSFSSTNSQVNSYNYSYTSGGGSSN